MPERSNSASTKQPDGTDSAQIEALLKALTLEEKVALMAGRDFWQTTPVPRLGIPSLKLSDGPNGARGDTASRKHAACFPVGVALGATFDTDLVAAVGRAIAEDGKQTKHVHGLLGPTINLHRHTTGGRNFECYGEDPLHTGHLAAAFVQGVQSQGVAACIKHFVANDQEYHRHTISAEVDERTLREIYLQPFETAVADADPWLVMSSYNRVNGEYASSHNRLLRDVLKTEWGFRGAVVSDWGAALETVANANAGMDLEMPGPSRSRGSALVEAVQRGDVEQAVIDDSVRRILLLAQLTGALTAAESSLTDNASENDTPILPEDEEDRPQHRALARKAAADGMVLLTNDGFLPIKPTLRRVAVIGPSAASGQIQGGGSSAVLSHPPSSPLDGLRAALPRTQLDYAKGCASNRYLPIPGPGMLRTPDGRDGLEMALYNPGANEPSLVRPVRIRFNPMGSVLPLNGYGAGQVSGKFKALLHGTFTPEDSGAYEFSLMSAGLARLFIDDTEVIDNWTQWTPGDSFFGNGSTERRVTLDMVAGKPVDYRIEFENPEHGGMITGVRYGIDRQDPEDLFEQALAAANAAEAAILVLGSHPDWESEGHDRADLSLPGRQAELVQAVTAVNPNTIVVLNTGGAIAMPWLGKPRAVVQAWLPGEEFGNALADILTGAVNPSGRLPATFPRKLSDTPAYTNYPGEHGRVRYGEGVFIGYRWFDARQIRPLAAFGHGLSYTTFAYENFTAKTIGDEIHARLDIVNTGDRAGQEVVQLYLGFPDSKVAQPPKVLRAFSKHMLQPGARETISFTLGERDLRYWHEPLPVDENTDRSGSESTAGWRRERGRVQVMVGASSRDIRSRRTVKIR